MSAAYHADIASMIEELRLHAERLRRSAEVWGEAGSTKVSRAVVRARADECERVANELTVVLHRWEAA